MAYIGEPSNGARNVRVTRPTGGSFTRGNRNSSFLGRAATPGLMATIANPVNPPDPKFFRTEPTAETRRLAGVERRMMSGRACPGCGMRTSVARTCFCW